MYVILGHHIGKKIFYILQGNLNISTLLGQPIIKRIYELYLKENNFLKSKIENQINYLSSPEYEHDLQINIRSDQGIKELLNYSISTSIWSFTILIVFLFMKNYYIFLFL